MVCIQINSSIIWYWCYFEWWLSQNVWDWKWTPDNICVPCWLYYIIELLYVIIMYYKTSGLAVETAMGVFAIPLFHVSVWVYVCNRFYVMFCHDHPRSSPQLFIGSSSWYKQLVQQTYFQPMPNNLEILITRHFRKVNPGL